MLKYLVIGQDLDTARALVGKATGNAKRVKDEPNHIVTEDERVFFTYGQGCFLDSNATACSVNAVLIDRRINVTQDQMRGLLAAVQSTKGQIQRF